MRTAAKALGTLTTGPIADLDEVELQARLQELWETGGLYFFGGVSDLMTSEVANQRVSDFFRAKIHERVADPKLAELLTPRGFFIGERRIIAENGYLEIFNRDDVSLVDAKSDPIVAITPDGMKTKEAEYPLDILILADQLRQRHRRHAADGCPRQAGASFHDKWAEGPSTYLGLTANGFPNMLMIAQPGSPSIRSQVLVSIEQHVDWVFDLLSRAASTGRRRDRGEPGRRGGLDAPRRRGCRQVALRAADTQYVGSNIPGKPRVYLAYLGGVGTYRKTCDTVRENGYEGFILKTGTGVLPGSAAWSGADELPLVWGTAVLELQDRSAATGRSNFPRAFDRAPIPPPLTPERG